MKAVPIPDTVEACLTRIDQELAQRRFETARRLSLAAYDKSNDTEIALRLHTAYVRLGDVRTGQELLLGLPEADTLAIKLLLAEDYYELTSSHHYREAEENKAGLCIDEYIEKYEKLSEQAFADALELIRTDEDKQLAAAALRRCKQLKQADALCPLADIVDDSLQPAVTDAYGKIAGKLTLGDGQPAAGVLVTLGLAVPVNHVNPMDYASPSMHYAFEMGERKAETCVTDASGSYCFDRVPAERHEFLAVTLAEHEYPIHTRFFAHDVVVRANETTTVDWTVSDWRSAPAKDHDVLLPEALELAGVGARKVHSEVLTNQFFYDFPTQVVSFPLPGKVPSDSAHLRLVSSAAPGESMPFQIIGNDVHFCTDLQACTEQLEIALYALDEAVTVDAQKVEWLEQENETTAILDTGISQFRIPLGKGEGAVAPIQAVKGPDGIWRGQGRWVLPGGVSVTSWSSRCLYQGPIACSVEIKYRLSNGDACQWTLTGHRDQEYLLVHEVLPELEGAAVEFSMKEFMGGRSYLHWNAENGSVHWRDIKPVDAELARLQESVAWWIPPQGFASAITKEGLEEKDFLSVFTIRRGEWIDRLFDRLTRGPGDDNRELDWPYPEMVGSTVSMITSQSSADGDVFFRWKLFDGERKSGFLVSSIEKNDGLWKELSAVQHKNSSPRLQDFKDWQFDQADKLERPFVVTRREELLGLKQKMTDSKYSAFWERVKGDQARGPDWGLIALLEGDPLKLWALKKGLVCKGPIRSRMTLLGREYSDMYSPVGARPITPNAEIYDLIAPTGVFTAEEEREVRASLLLMGHMYMEEDLMNWRYNSRNANFEADRVDVVGAVGLAFRGNPDADRMVQHAAELMQRSLETYCTPGSGKWYENPACYYIHAASCRLNLAWHLYAHGIMDSTEIARLKDFLSWGPNLLTPAFPHDNELLIEGCSHDEFRAADRARRIPPVGDHAKLGQWVSEFFAIMGKAYEQRDPEFANYLKWAYFEGGRNGGHFNKYPLYFCVVEESDLVAPKPVELSSRRLEGFGSIFRGNFGKDEEFYLLFKLGPGGYRYHRTEGSIILFADGKPLIYDGGEAGETWRHTTLSFGETHMPLAPGHIERFHSFAALDFSQGVNPKALEPGEAVFLSDPCEHTLVKTAYERYAEPNPAESRSCLWVKDEYLILHDQLRLPENLLTHWHLQAVANTHEMIEANNYRFHGRYGTDLQVVLPGQSFSNEKVSQIHNLEYHTPTEQCFSMRHLQLSSISPESIAAVIRPLAGDRSAVEASYDGSVLEVNGENIADLHVFDRNGTTVKRDGLVFEGCYASVLQRDDELTLALIDGTSLSFGGITVTAEGTSVTVTKRGSKVHMSAEGKGHVNIEGLTEPVDMNINESGRVEMNVPSVRE